ncbi:DUF7502 family protein [Halorussus marinus]|uniref:DUF7502 family protein n=1 Tax=Halorussus marinus TaxID=2505976 RepID=UPI00109303C8|nr:hypothetical protein [Halorussus marinus]
MSQESPDEVRRALAAVRREQYKAAFVHASLEAVTVALGVHLLAGVAGLPTLDAEVFTAAFKPTQIPAPDVGAVLAVVAGLITALTGFGIRARRPAAEAFETANPEVATALRTARDAVGDDRDDPMARALYGDVLDSLTETSSVRLLDRTRIVAAVAVAFALSLASVQTAVVGLDLAGPPSDATGVGDGSVTDRTAVDDPSSTVLRDGDELLGEPTDVEAGSENLTASVGSSPGGEGESVRDYDRDAGADPDAGSVDAVRADYAAPERVEEAELVRRYARELGGNDTDV